MDLTCNPPEGNWATHTENGVTITNPTYQPPVTQQPMSTGLISDRIFEP